MPSSWARSTTVTKAEGYPQVLIIALSRASAYNCREDSFRCGLLAPCHAGGANGTGSSTLLRVLCIRR